MSIAVSAVVYRSRIVLCMALGMCLGSAVIGVLFASNTVGALSPAWRAAVTAACLGAGALAAYRLLHKRRIQRIDISGNGQIRVYETVISVSACSQPLDRVRSNVSVQQLMSSSTLWSNLMLLNLRAEDGGRTNLLILPDTMSQTSFHGLSVACHWIAAHNNRAGTEFNESGDG